MVLLEVVELRPVHLEVYRRAVFRVGGLDLVVYADAFAVALEDGILQQETERGHSWDEHLTRIVHLASRLSSFWAIGGGRSPERARLIDDAQHADLALLAVTRVCCGASEMHEQYLQTATELGRALSRPRSQSWYIPTVVICQCSFVATEGAA